MIRKTIAALAAVMVMGAAVPALADSHPTLQDIRDARLALEDAQVANRDAADGSRELIEIMSNRLEKAEKSYQDAINEYGNYYCERNGVAPNPGSNSGIHFPDGYEWPACPTTS